MTVSGLGVSSHILPDSDVEADCEEAYSSDCSSASANVPRAVPRRGGEKNEAVFMVGAHNVIMGLDRRRLALRMAAFDRASVLPLDEQIVGEADVDHFLAEHAAFLANMRSVPITSERMLRRCPPELADEPVYGVHSDVDGLSAAGALRALMRTKLSIDVHVLLLAAVGAATMMYESNVVWPEWHRGTHHWDPFIIAVDTALLNSLLNLSTLMLIYKLLGTRILRTVTNVYFTVVPIIFVNALVAAMLGGIQVLRAVYYLAFTLCWLVPAFVARRISLGEDYVRKLALPQLLGVVIYASYTLLLPHVWAAMSSDWHRAAFRLVIHPLVFELSMIAVRMGGRTMRLVDPRVFSFLLLNFQLANALFGRFLVAATEHQASTVIISILLALQETTLRLSVGGRDRFLFRLWKGSHLDDAELAVRFQTPRALRMRGELVAQDQIVESTGIIISSLSILFFNVQINGQNLSTGRILAGLAVQLVIAYATDLAIMCLELRARVPIFGIWRHRGLGGRTDMRRRLSYLATMALFVYIATRLFTAAVFSPISDFAT